MTVSDAKIVTYLTSNRLVVEPQQCGVAKALPDHAHINIEQPATQPQKENHMPLRNGEPPTGRKGLACIVVMALLATMLGILLLWQGALQQHLLQGALAAVLVSAGITAGVRFRAIRAFFRRKRRPAGLKKPSLTKSSVGRTVEEERHPLRYGDQIPQAHFWWF